MKQLPVCRLGELILMIWELQLVRLPWKYSEKNFTDFLLKGMKSVSHTDKDGQNAD